jgi:uncharacterized protein YciI
MSEDVLDQLQDQHLAHLADLYDAGLLLAAGCPGAMAEASADG